MPIRPENLARYPVDWPRISLRILARARWKCEDCGVHGGAWGYRDDGKFHRVNKRQMIDLLRSPGQRVKPPFMFGPHKVIEIVLTVAHLDHQPENCAEENLRAMCQKCHLAYDHAHHQRNAYETRRKGKAVDMFDSPDLGLEQP